MKTENMISQTKYRKGIILAGGTGSRLAPITFSCCKQLMPVYDKPMIHYPLSTLILADIREILIITTREDQHLFKRLLGNGQSIGIEISYGIQEEPNGLGEAFIIGEEFLGNSSAALALGDNIFHGNELIAKVNKANSQSLGGTIFAYPVVDPERYGVVELDKFDNAISLEEKPSNPKSSLAVTGLYFYDNTIVDRAKSLKPSKRGELEITELNQMYLNDGLLKVESFGRGMAWLDTGTFDSLHEASSYIRTLEHIQGLKVCCPEEISWRKGWIDDNQLEMLALKFKNNDYGKYLFRLLGKG